VYLKIGRKIINTSNLVDADVYEVGEDMTPHRDGPAEARAVVITTTAVAAAEDGTPTARKIVLEGEDADLFLGALPVYEPVLEDA
jgi:hypothetical protein